MDAPFDALNDMRARELLKRLFSGAPGHIRDHEAVRIIVGRGLADHPRAEVLVQETLGRLRTGS